MGTGGTGLTALPGLSAGEASASATARGAASVPWRGSPVPMPTPGGMVSGTGFFSGAKGARPRTALPDQARLKFTEKGRDL